ncbi:uncharacterized protein LOC143914862 [Arctopsyche grandis]|uniref:uncharacterized protein LOC143914862 n=1 Tax=Arctopsyche grandis TaxID=121162 RepID=UPI00406D9FFF
MAVNRGEDKPLLVSILDGTSCGSKGSDDEAYIDAKYGQSSSMIRRWKYGANGGNGKAKNVIMGAASIFKKLPDNMTMFWLVAVAFCMIVITLILMIESSMKPSAPQSFSVLSIQKKCLARHESIIKNTPQQFPEKTNVYMHVILNGKQKFETEKHKTLFTSIVEHHPNHFFNVYVLYNDTNEMNYKRNARFKDWELYHNTFDAPKFFLTSSAEDEQNAIIPFHAQRDDMGDLIHFENINIIRSSLSSYFLHSPLRFRWRILPDSMIPFVLRVLSLWEHGGITMPWQLFRDKTDIYCVNKDITGQFQDLVQGFNKKDLFVENAPTTRKTKQEIIDEIQSFVDIGGGALTIIESEPKLNNVIEEPMRHFNLNDTELLEKNPNKKAQPIKTKQLLMKAEARAMAKALKAQRPQDYNSNSEDDDDESSSSSSSSLNSSAAFIKKLKTKLLTNDKDSENLSSTERKIRKMLKNPNLRKKLAKVNVANAMEKDSRLQNPDRKKLEKAKMERAMDKDTMIQNPNLRMKLPKVNIGKDNVMQDPNIRMKLPKVNIEKDNLMQDPNIRMKLPKIDEEKVMERDTMVRNPNQRTKLPKVNAENAMENKDNVLQDPNLRKKLTEMNVEKDTVKQNPNLETLPEVNVDNAMKTERLRRIKRDLQPVPPLSALPSQLNTLPLPDIAALKKPTGFEDKMKTVRRLPEDQPRYDDHSSRRGSSDVVTSEFDSSEYYDSSTSYSGYKALKPFKTDFGRKKPTFKGLEWPSSSASMYKRVVKRSSDTSSSSSSSESSVKTLGGISSSVSDSSLSRESKNYFREKKAYVNHKVFENMNVFTMPGKMSLTVDRFGYYFSTKKPCHAFLGELISILQSSNELKDADTVVEKGLRGFCRGRKYSECAGISLL